MEKDQIYTIDYDEQNQYLLVKVNGELSIALLQKLARDVTRIAQEKNCRRVLNNLMDAVIVTDTLEIYKMPQQAQNTGIDANFKRALVVGDRGEEFYFLETVFKNQGHLVKMFTNFEEAKSWLLSSC